MRTRILYHQRSAIVTAWQAIDDDSTILRFGFARADFPNAAPPPLPAYAPLRARSAADILMDLAQIDVRSIRALREGDNDRIASLEAEAAALRAELAAIS